jgi:hypothetical protein
MPKVSARWLSAEDVAASLGVTRRTVRSWTLIGPSASPANPKGPTLRGHLTDGGHLRFSPCQVHRYLAGLSEKTPKSLRKRTPRVVLLMCDQSTASLALKALGSKLGATRYETLSSVLLDLTDLEPEAIVLDPEEHAAHLVEALSTIRMHPTLFDVALVLFSRSVEGSETLTSLVDATVPHAAPGQLRKALFDLLGLE